MLPMLNCSFRTAVITFIFCSLFLPVAASAEIIDDISRDFGIISGYVVKSDGREAIIDLSAQQRIGLGDLFSVVKPGSELVHPVTKQVLGRLEDIKGQLQVTRIQDGYSFARIIHGGQDIQPGDAIRRFKGTDAVFWDYSGHSEPFYNKLRLAVPHLNWHAYEASQQDKPVEKNLAPGKTPALYFIMGRDVLEVRDPGFVVLHSYRFGDATPGASEYSTAGSDKKVVGSLPVPDKGAAIVRRDTSGNENPWNGPAMYGTPVGMEVGDFDGDGMQEIAVAFPDRLEIGRNIRGEYRQVETVSLSGIGSCVALDRADFDGKGRMELCLSAVTQNGDPYGMTIGMTKGHCEIIRKGIPWLMHRVTLPGEGSVLLGQSYRPSDKGLWGPVFRISCSGSDLIQGAVLDIPKGMSLYGFVPIGAASQPLVASLSYDNHLRVTGKDGNVIWEGEEQVGGSESYVEIPPAVKGLDDSQLIFLNARLDMSAVGELLVPLNRGINVTSRMRMYTESELKAMVWDGTTMRESWSTVPKKGYLADFCMADGDNDGREDLVTIIAYPQHNPFGKRKSTIQIYRLH